MCDALGQVASATQLILGEDGGIRSCSISPLPSAAEGSLPCSCLTSHRQSACSSGHHRLRCRLSAFTPRPSSTCYICCDRFLLKFHSKGRDHKPTESYGGEGINWDIPRIDLHDIIILFLNGNYFILEPLTKYQLCARYRAKC